MTGTTMTPAEFLAWLKSVLLSAGEDELSVLEFIEPDDTADDAGYVIRLMKAPGFEIIHRLGFRYDGQNIDDAVIIAEIDEPWTVTRLAADVVDGGRVLSDREIGRLVCQVLPVMAEFGATAAVDDDLAVDDYDAPAPVRILPVDLNHLRADN